MSRFLKNFFKCGIAGWCLEVIFTSAESILARDWRLMGHTSLLMFPIYGMGALLGPIGSRVESMDWRWKQRDGDAIKSDGQSGPSWDAVHGFDFSCRIFVRNVFKR